MRVLALLCLPFFACTTGKVNFDDTAQADADTDTDTDTDSDTDADTDSDTDADTDTDVNDPDLLFSNISWRLWDEVESVAFVGFTLSQPATVHVEYKLDDEWHSGHEYSLEAGENELTVIGIPYDTTADWRLVAGDGTTHDGPSAITTGEIPSRLPVGTVLTSEPTLWLQEGNYFLTSINSNSGGWTGGNYYTMIFDREGRVVWAHLAPDEHWTLYTQVALTGDHILWDEATYWSDWGDGEGGKIHRWYLDAEISEIPTDGLHHAFVQMPPDGETLIWGSKYHARNTEALVEMTEGETEATVLWTCADDWPGVEDCESNCVYYSPERNSIFYSFYTNSSLVEIDYDTLETKWWAGEVEDGYAFDPEDTQFYWQHGVTWTPDDTLLLSSTRGGNTTLREYTIDEPGETLHEVWEYDSGSHADTNGDAWRLSNGNTLHVVGSASNVYEVQSDGTKVWEIDWGRSNLMGRGQFIEDLYDLVQPRGQ